MAIPASRSLPCCAEAVLSCRWKYPAGLPVVSPSVLGRRSDSRAIPTTCHARFSCPCPEVERIMDRVPETFAGALLVPRPARRLPCRALPSAATAMYRLPRAGLSVPVQAIGEWQSRMCPRSRRSFWRIGAASPDISDAWSWAGATETAGCPAGDPTACGRVEAADAPRGVLREAQGRGGDAPRRTASLHCAGRASHAAGATCPFAVVGTPHRAARRACPEGSTRRKAAFPRMLLPEVPAAAAGMAASCRPGGRVLVFRRRLG